MTAERVMNAVIYNCPHCETKGAQDIKALLDENFIKCRIENAEGEWIVFVYPEDMEEAREAIRIRDNSSDIDEKDLERLKEAFWEEE